MTPKLLITFAAVALLTGCAASRGVLDRAGDLIGLGEAEPVPARAAAGAPAEAPLLAPADISEVLPAVRYVSADRGRQGLILRAEGVAPTQGYHTPELRRVGTGADGVDVLELRALPPPEPHPVGAEPTRLIAVGRFYTNRELRDIRGFRVLAARNSAAAATPEAPAAPPPSPDPDF